MRLIDADELERKIMMMPDDVLCEDCCYNVVNAIDAMPTIATDINVPNKWTSVKDRLPELGKNVLVYAVGRIDGFIGESEIAICSRYIMRVFPSSPGHETWSSPWQCFNTYYEITHWMPLPEPPKE